MAEHLEVLESAISDVGYWTWWTAKLPGIFQIEFNGTQFWNSPSGEGKPPSGQIALRFNNPRLVDFLTFEDSMPEDWPTLLQQDKIRPFTINYDKFTLTAAEHVKELREESKSMQRYVGSPADGAAPIANESFLGFQAGNVGLVVIAESMSVMNSAGVVRPEKILASNEEWWEYWKDYWLKRDSSHPLPKDYACEVTIPLR